MSRPGRGRPGGRTAGGEPVGRGPRPSTWCGAGALAAALLLAHGTLAAQAPEVIVGSDTLRVGDVVPVRVRVTVAPGERVLWPDTLPLAGVAAENAARVRERVDTLPDGRLARTGEYAVTPWRTGELELPDLTVPVLAGDESPRERRAELPTLSVASVLPADTAGVEPRPARGVLGPSWAWGRILLLALLAAAVVAALLAWWWRRREARPAEVLEPSVPPRDRALAALGAARDAGLLERGEVKEFYTRVSDAVRDYAAALERSWGEDLTTTELLGRLRAQVGPREAGALGDVLRPADQVKFARRSPDRDTALAEWETARSWVEDFDWPPRPAREEAA